MATLRDLKRRIRSVQSTRQITKAMEMVAAAKLRKAQVRAHQARPFAAGMVQVLAAFAAAPEAQAHPLFQARPVRRRGLIVIAAERGLCGAYNSTLLRAADQYLHEAGVPVGFHLVGRKAIDYMTRRKREIDERYTDLPAQADFATARTVAHDAVRSFLSGRVDAVDLLYTHFISTLNRNVVVEPFLPISSEAAAGPGAARTRDFILEPDVQTIFEHLLPRYAHTRLFLALAEAYASEQSARMVAMGAANNNAGEMIDSLTLLRNRLRQAAITREIAEIVGGAEALA
ncbi:MAG TPA: ATP synthase F1 subunit gamma [Candidatus Saccharimonadales bacterium]|nr:ATP synthase F1 subunit gamma [Candidatus Saccharimonadales bacterium]